MLARVPFAAVAALAIATAVAASPEAAPTNPCRAALPHGPAVPAPIVLWNSCGRFRLDTDGGVIRLSRRWLARHRDGTGRRYGADLRLRNTRQGEIVILRQQRTIWRSSGLYKNEGGSLAFGPGLFAFSSYRRGVYLTDLHHPERLVIRGSGLYPLDFRRDGKLIVVGRGLIWVVSPTGKTLHRYPYRRSSRTGLRLEARPVLLRDTGRHSRDG